MNRKGATMAPPPASKAPAPPPRERGLAGFVRVATENLECLAIAIVMALVLKHFLIDAYKIPSGSMQPTIMGDRQLDLCDRVLVNKLLYLLRPPERWEVIVFKMPLVQRENYIKRLVGMPGETLTIRNGDLFVIPSGGTQADEEIARKPDSVWRSVRKRIFPGYHEKLGLADLFEPDGPSGSTRIQDGEILLGPPSGQEAAIRLKRELRDNYYDGYAAPWVPFSEPEAWRGNKNPVSDVELVAEVLPSPAARSVVLEIQESRFVHRMELDFTSGSLALNTTLREPAEGEPGRVVFVTEPVTLGRERSVVLSFRNVDDELVAGIDGHEVRRVPYRTTGIDPPGETQVVIRALGGDLVVRDVSLYRDIHYLSTDGSRQSQFLVGDGEYFAMGDNTQNSADCRDWKLLELTLRDGRTITGNYLPEPHPDANPRLEGRTTVVFENVYGEPFRLDRADIVSETKVPYRQIPAEFLLGRAMAIFWPLPPFSPTWRLKWVR